MSSLREIIMEAWRATPEAEPEDIAPLVLFLCSDEARHITGQTIKIDAGQYM